VTRAALIAAVALLVGATAAYAHQGSPNFLSQVNRITPPTDGITVTVLNRDDQLLLHNTSGKSVVVEGYSEEPYARIDPDGTVSVNTDSQAYYLNQERDGDVETPAGVDSKGAPRWKEVSRTGRFEWHDHRMHWMSKADPKVVKDKNVRTKVFDWRVPLDVDGRRGEIAGTLFWTPTPSSSVPLVPILGFVLAGIALSIAVTIVRRRRTDQGPAEVW
jgi:hypothetical protein